MQIVQCLALLDFLSVNWNNVNVCSSAKAKGHEATESNHFQPSQARDSISDVEQWAIDKKFRPIS